MFWVHVSRRVRSDDAATSLSSAVLIGGALGVALAHWILVILIHAIINAKKI